MERPGLLAGLMKPCTSQTKDSGQFICPLRKDVEGLDAESLRAFKAYGWPGNLRELWNAIERSVVTREQGRIALNDLPEKIYVVRHSEGHFVVRVGSTLEAAEHELIRTTLEATGK
jgi:transcriptional regulator with PAS, ATPase and Fis domain